MLAAEQGRKETASLLLLSDKDDSHERSEEGKTFVMWAAGNGRNDIIEALLDTGLVNSSKKDKNGFTPERWAKKHRHTEAAQLFARSRWAWTSGTYT
ncbi:uncharacterized protein EKO05_0003256 [Ascochyta rabiei]|uniref:uncharacterized protein n=1 Tax=Didymella rabiei TaxID=5454 RepID=UPI0018FF69AD|nr:uncharacterized protein EKO05_0003256 [Ascochyta rabiei]UPX12717.1 hypothetical protein EKO05_0003256 [Ascochyta rabiei]